MKRFGPILFLALVLSTFSYADIREEILRDPDELQRHLRDLSHRDKADDFLDAIARILVWERTYQANLAKVGDGGLESYPTVVTLTEFEVRLRYLSVVVRCAWAEDVPHLALTAIGFLLNEIRDLDRMPHEELRRMQDAILENIRNGRGPRPTTALLIWQDLVAGDGQFARLFKVQDNYGDKATKNETSRHYLLGVYLASLTNPENAEIRRALRVHLTHLKKAGYPLARLARGEAAVANSGDVFTMVHRWFKSEVMKRISLAELAIIADSSFIDKSVVANQTERTHVVKKTLERWFDATDRTIIERLASFETHANLDRGTPDKAPGGLAGAFGDLKNASDPAYPHFLQAAKRHWPKDPQFEKLEVVYPAHQVPVTPSVYATRDKQPIRHEEFRLAAPTTETAGAITPPIRATAQSPIAATAASAPQAVQTASAPAGTGDTTVVTALLKLPQPKVKDLQDLYTRIVDKKVSTLSVLDIRTIITMLIAAFKELDTNAAAPEAIAVRDAAFKVLDAVHALKIEIVLEAGTPLQRPSDIFTANSTIGMQIHKWSFADNRAAHAGKGWALRIIQRLGKTTQDAAKIAAEAKRLRPAAIIGPVLAEPDDEPAVATATSNAPVAAPEKAKGGTTTSAPLAPTAPADATPIAPAAPIAAVPVESPAATTPTTPAPSSDPKPVAEDFVADTGVDEQIEILLEKYLDIATAISDRVAAGNMLAEKKTELNLDQMRRVAGLVMSLQKATDHDTEEEQEIYRIGVRLVILSPSSIAKIPAFTDTDEVLRRLILDATLSGDNVAKAALSKGIELANGRAKPEEILAQMDAEIEEEIASMDPLVLMPQVIDAKQPWAKTVALSRKLALSCVRKPLDLFQLASLTPRIVALAGKPLSEDERQLLRNLVSVFIISWVNVPEESMLMKAGVKMDMKKIGAFAEVNEVLTASESFQDPIVSETLGLITAVHKTSDDVAEVLKHFKEGCAKPLELAGMRK